MVFNRDEIVKRALASKTNVPNTCQLWTRTVIGVGSAGDRDRDGDADAVDGWLSEPSAHKHTDRNPPAGVPVSWSGGSHGNGHRAVSLGHGMIRSTDAGGSGRVATVHLDWVEKNWGLKYLGWSDTMDGVLIPMPPPPPKTSAGARVEHAIDDLESAKGKGDRRDLINKALRVLNRIKKIK